MFEIQESKTLNSAFVVFLYVMPLKFFVAWKITNFKNSPDCNVTHLATLAKHRPFPSNLI